MSPEQLLRELPFEVPVLIDEYLTLLLSAALVLALLSLLLAIRALRRAAAMERHYQALMTGVSGTDLASVLESQGTGLSSAEQRISRLEQRTAGLDQDIARIGQTEAGIAQLRDHTQDMGLHAQRIQGAEGNLGHLQARIATVEARLAQALRLVSLKRYRAFEDAGGDQSFSLAVLDDAGDGVVLSSLHGRSGARIYAKPVKGRISPYALTEEEQAAIADSSAEKHVDTPRNEA